MRLSARMARGSSPASGAIMTSVKISETILAAQPLLHLRRTILVYAGHYGILGKQYFLLQKVSTDEHLGTLIAMRKLSEISRRLKRPIYNVRLRLNRLIGRSFVESFSFFSFEIAGICNLACRFCAYPKKEIGKSVMSLETFSALLEQSLDLGYRDVGLTPMTGEVFMDKNIIEKMEVLEKNPRVRSFWFYSNFILVDEEKINRMSKMRKIGPEFYISLYGHNQAMFCKVTNRPEKQYWRLIDNLNYLADVAPEFDCIIDVGIRTSASFFWKPEPGNTDEPNPLLRAINRVMENRNCRYSGNVIRYDSWGGWVSQEDVEGLDMKVVDAAGAKTPKVGACALIFDRPIIFADGRVNACHCRGMDRSLVIGDVHNSSLSEIFSLNNKQFTALIDRQQKGDFPTACHDCSMYRSIYRSLKRTPTISIEEYFRIVRERPESLQT